MTCYEVRLDDNEIRISDARRADVTGFDWTVTV